MTRRNTVIVMDSLESRRLLAADYPTANEQYLIELVNRARQDPTAEASRDGIALNEGLAAGTISADAKQPLAINPNLTDSAGNHSAWQLANGVFSHDEGTVGPQQRMSNAGYVFAGNSGAAENIGLTLSSYIQDEFAATNNLHNTLFVDATQIGRAHRVTMMNGSFKEVGPGVVSGPMLYNGTNYSGVAITEDFAVSSGNAAGDSFLTGVVYRDTVARDSFYTPGEGVGSVTITAKRTSDNATFSTTTWAAGGYSLRLNPGTYTVTAAGAGITPITYSNVVIGAENVKRDFVPGADTTPPTASAGAFAYQSAPMKITIQFSEPVQASLSASDLQLHALGSATLIPVTLSDYSASNVATFTIPSALPDGNYRATLPAGSVTDSAGNALATDYSVDFFALAGDANRNRIVDTPDFTSLATNFNKSGLTFDKGDFNGDGKVNALDMNILASKFGAKVAAAASSLSIAIVQSNQPAPTHTASLPLFSDYSMTLLDSGDILP